MDTNKTIEIIEGRYNDSLLKLEIMVCLTMEIAELLDSHGYDSESVRNESDEIESIIEGVRSVNKMIPMLVIGWDKLGESDDFVKTKLGQRFAALDEMDASTKTSYASYVEMFELLNRRIAESK